MISWRGCLKWPFHGVFLISIFINIKKFHYCVTLCSVYIFFVWMAILDIHVNLQNFSSYNVWNFNVDFDVFYHWTRWVRKWAQSLVWNLDWLFDGIWKCGLEKDHCQWNVVISTTKDNERITSQDIWTCIFLHIFEKECLHLLDWVLCFVFVLLTYLFHR